MNTRGASFVAWLFHFHERKRLFLRFPQILHLADDHYKYSWISMFIITLNNIAVIIHRLSAKSSLTCLTLILTKIFYSFISKYDERYKANHSTYPIVWRKFYHFVLRYNALKKHYRFTILIKYFVFTK